MWLIGIASGSTVFHLESAHQWTSDGRAARQYTRFILPFVSAVVEHRLLPSRAAFLNSIKLAVSTDLEFAKGKHGKQYAGGYSFLKDLYAITAPGDQDLIPNDSRYGIVCLLPPGTAEMTGATRTIPQAKLRPEGMARELFDAAYPRRFTGEAFMWECDGTVIVTNSNENQDQNQRYAMPLGTGLVRTLNGTVGVHQYLIGKTAPDGRSFWFQVNGEYPDRELDLSIECERKPDWQVRPESAATEAAWDETGKVLRLKLSFKEGASEVTVR
jgi:hypothetical protein